MNEKKEEKKTKKNYHNKELCKEIASSLPKRSQVDY